MGKKNKDVEAEDLGHPLDVNDAPLPPKDTIDDHETGTVEALALSDPERTADLDAIGDKAEPRLAVTDAQAEAQAAQQAELADETALAEQAARDRAAFVAETLTPKAREAYAEFIRVKSVRERPHCPLTFDDLTSEDKAAWLAVAENYFR